MSATLKWSIALMLLQRLIFPQLAAAEGPAPARALEAQPDSGDAAYDTLIKKALVEFNLGHWNEARAYFLRAHQLKPNARTLRSIGLASYEMRLYVVALGYLRDALASSEHALTPEMRAQAQNEVEEARSFVSHFALALEPKTLRLQVDGQPAAFDDDGSMILDPGQHELVAEAPGYQTQTRSIAAHGADRSELRISLLPQPSAAVEPFTPRPQPAPQPSASTQLTAARPARVETSFWSTRTTPQWVGLGLGAGAVVALGVGAVFGALALSDNSESEKFCTGNVCQAAGYTHRERALARADVASVSFITAGVLAAGAALCYFAIPGGERPASAFRWSPVIARDGVAFAASGSF